MNDVDVKIHMCDCARLGGKGQWSWRQNNVSSLYWRLYWNRGPGGFVTVDGQEYELLPDAVFLMTPYTVYSTRAEIALEHFYIHFTVGEPLDQVNTGFIRLGEAELARDAADVLNLFFREPDSWMVILRIKALIIQALLGLPSGVVMPRRQYSPAVKRAMHMIVSGDGRLNREIAGRVGMSVNSFITLFRRETGIPPQEWGRRKRLEKAGEMLHFGEESIEEIAIETGFCDRYHFSKVFKQKYNTSPAEYRKLSKRLLSATVLKSGAFH